MLDTHTAVALKVYEDYCEKTGDERTAVIDSTANPYKFVSSVYQALSSTSEAGETDDLLLLNQLERLSQMPVHRGLVDLDKKEIRHKACCERSAIKKQIEAILNL